MSLSSRIVIFTLPVGSDPGLAMRPRVSLLKSTGTVRPLVEKVFWPGSTYFKKQANAKAGVRNPARLSSGPIHK